MMATEHRKNLRPADGYFVRRPRATDAVGHALRNAFGDADDLPEDFAQSLAALDQATRCH
ncbi:hypothetical protein [Sphingomonas radiodurans]|uniref:hypothetical protein n=1 Tax=Sphingomonas radiodurans TaxID=2890321 RepID=UPI001E46F17D|nr:hypothetical protein [Sphingomonas radiodurans]WBH16966.1 hypothetical protein LLW23_02265 [Sphingomonas radiodurans]